jgi:predicted anti-sigma-YlaC factor YlaD
MSDLLGPKGPEIGCDACFELVDEYVDLELEGANTDTRIPGMGAHLQGCGACREEYEALRELAASEA